MAGTAVRKSGKDEAKLTRETKAQVKVSNFFLKYKKIFIISSIVVVVAILVLAVILKGVEGKETERQLEVYALSKQMNTILSAEELPEADYNTLVNNLKALAADGEKEYSGQKAQYLLALCYSGAGKASDALAAFNTAYAMNKKSYLAYLSLMNVAVITENNGDAAGALKLYEQIITDFGTDCTVAPKALFSSARIYLAQGNKELAKTTFQRVVDLYGSASVTSEYVTLSQNALLVL